jgi:thiosulfate reductase cytochrome b subunit
MKPRELHHPPLLRLAHWGFAVAILLLIGSGWRIYDASPIFFFRIPAVITLGGSEPVALAWHNDPGVATAIAWHLAAIWLLFASFALYVVWGVLTGHFRRDFLPLTPRRFLRDFIAAARFRLAHDITTYNAVQKAFYWGVLLAVSMMLISGLAIWKPVQFEWLTALCGGFQGARLVHFLFMASLVGFIAVHLALVALVPRTLVAMTLGRVRVPEPHQETELLP